MATVGSVSAALNKMYEKANKRVWEIICDWTPDKTAGTVNVNLASNLCSKGAMKTDKFTGYLRTVVSIPGTSGVVALNTATDLDIRLLDSYSIDLAGNELWNASTSAGLRIEADPPVFVNDEITLSIASIGNSTGSGRVIIYMEV